MEEGTTWMVFAVTGGKVTNWEDVKTVTSGMGRTWMEIL